MDFSYCHRPKHCLIVWDHQHVNLAWFLFQTATHFHIVSYRSREQESGCCDSLLSPAGIGAKAGWQSSRCSAVAVGCSVHVCRSSIWLSPLTLHQNRSPKINKPAARPGLPLMCVCLKSALYTGRSIFKRKTRDILHMGAKKNWTDKLIDGMKIKWIMFCGKGAKSDLHSGCDRYNLQDFFFSVYILNDEKWFLYHPYSPHTHACTQTHRPY